MQNHGVVLLTCSGQESRHVHQRDDGDVESVAETHEAGTLARSVRVEHTGISRRLVGHDTHALSVETGESRDDVLGKLRLHLKEFSIIGQGCDDLIHVVSLVGVVGDDVVQDVLLAVDGVVALCARSLLHVVRRNVAQERLDHRHRLLLGLRREVGHTALRGMHRSATQMLGVHTLARHRLHNGRTCQEHVRRVLHHQDEVREGRGVNGTTGTRAHDGRNLRNHTTRQDVALEDLTIASQRADALLDACATRVVHANHGSAVLHGHVHHLADLLAHRLRE